MGRWLLLCIMLVVVAALACDRSSEAAVDLPTPPPPAELADVPLAAPEPEHVVDRLMMWEVAPKDAPHARSHLVGTFHVGTDFHGLGELPQAGQDAFRKARVIALEADLGVVDPALETLMTINGPRTLDAMLTPEQWEVALEHTGMPPQRLKRLRPHVVAAELAHKWTPGAGVRGMDGRLRILAKAHDKKLAYLETPREQIEMLSEAVTAEMLGETLDNAEDEQERAKTLLRIFKQGDTEALAAQLFAPAHVETHRDFYEKVFWSRNRRWLEPLDDLLRDGGAFVAVGAGHLVGESNLRTLLEEAGYSVVEVP